MPGYFGHNTFFLPINIKMPAQHCSAPDFLFFCIYKLKAFFQRFVALLFLLFLSGLFRLLVCFFQRVEQGAQGFGKLSFLARLVYYKRLFCYSP